MTSLPPLTVASLATTGTLGVSGTASIGIATVSQLCAGGASGRAPVITSMPVMTTNTVGGFTVSSSTNDRSTPACYAFDSSSTTNWLSASGKYSSGAYTGTVTTGSTKGEYLQIQTPVLCQLQSYSLFGSSTHALTAFSIMGSSDGVTYTTIDTRSGQDCTTQQVFIAPTQTTSFLYLRLIIAQDINTNSTTAASVSNFAPVFLGMPYTLDVNGPSRVTGTLMVTDTASTGLLTTASINNTGDLAVTGASNFTGLATASAGINVLGNAAFSGGVVTAGTLQASGGVKLPDSRTLEFGSNLSKATNAGSIGYQLATPSALDIYGGGTTVGSRSLQLWDNVTIAGGLRAGIWDVCAALATFGRPAALFPSPPGPVSNNTDDYVITASSNSSTAYQAFTTTGWTSALVYGATNAAPATTNYTTMSDTDPSSSSMSITGEWVQIQLPCSLSLALWQSASSGYPPDQTYVLASFDGTTWYSCCSSSTTVPRAFPTIFAPQVYSKQSFTYFRIVFYLIPSTYQPVNAGGGAQTLQTKNVSASNIWLGGVGTRKLAKWTPLALASGVGTYQSSVPAFSKDALGMVTLRGMMSIPSGTNITLATLPPLCRPLTSNGTTMPSYAGNAFCVVQIDTSGVIKIISGGSTTFLSLNNLQFDTN